MAAQQVASTGSLVGAALFCSNYKFAPASGEFAVTCQPSKNDISASALLINCTKLRAFPPGAFIPQHVQEILLLGESAASEGPRLPCGLMTAAGGLAAAWSVFSRHYEGLSHAQWPKYKHEYAPS
jgi:hypothetical protein